MCVDAVAQPAVPHPSPHRGCADVPSARACRCSASPSPAAWTWTAMDTQVGAQRTDFGAGVNEVGVKETRTRQPRL